MNSAVDATTRRIQMDDPEDVRYWIAHYGCTEAQLAGAVEAAGPLAKDVREYIAKQAKQAMRSRTR